MIKTLTSWRGIFALCIVCFHFAMHEFDQMTYAGVTFFFMLSGFLVTYKHETLNSVKSFYSRRLWRIFPLHWLVLVAMILLDLAVHPPVPLRLGFATAYHVAPIVDSLQINTL